MTTAAPLLAEFDQEMATTRRVLAAIPDDGFAFRPHPQSWPMGALATHVAQIPQWIALTLGQDSFDFAPPGQPPPRAEEARSGSELLARFDRHVAAARTALQSASDATLAAPWTLLHGGRTIFSRPRADVLRSFAMNHLIHHRGQLSLYFRLAGLKVPPIYGPTADEN
jgi:uncharacterized damage-inducible protein DinB